MALLRQPPNSTLETSNKRQSEDLRVSSLQDPDKAGTARRHLSSVIESENTNVYSLEVTVGMMMMAIMIMMTTMAVSMMMMMHCSSG